MVQLYAVQFWVYAAHIALQFWVFHAALKIDVVQLYAMQFWVYAAHIALQFCVPCSFENCCSSVICDAVLSLCSSYSFAVFEFHAALTIDVVQLYAVQFWAYAAHTALQFWVFAAHAVQFCGLASYEVYVILWPMQSYNHKTAIFLQFMWLYDLIAKKTAQNCQKDTKLQYTFMQFNFQDFAARAVCAAASLDFIQSMQCNCAVWFKIQAA